LKVVDSFSSSIASITSLAVLATPSINVFCIKIKLNVSTSWITALICHATLNNNLFLKVYMRLTFHQPESHKISPTMDLP
jgi:hypothetical protein